MSALIPGDSIILQIVWLTLQVTTGCRLWRPLAGGNGGIGSNYRKQNIMGLLEMMFFLFKRTSLWWYKTQNLYRLCGCFMNHKGIQRTAFWVIVLNFLFSSWRGNSDSSLLYSQREWSDNTSSYLFLFSEENKVRRIQFEGGKVAGSTTCKQSRTIRSCVLCNL